MSLKAGIVGLPNVGKTSLFNALTHSNADSANYPFTTIKPNKAFVELPDSRIEVLANLVKPQKVIPASFEFVDIAGLVLGASKGEGRGNQFLNDIRGVDVVIHVIRCFETQEVLHVVDKSLNPINDLEIINLELILSDLQIIESLLHKKKKVALGENESLVLKKFEDCLKNEQLLYQKSWTVEEIMIAKKYQLLTIKPFIFVANLEEQHLLNPEESNNFKMLENYCLKKGFLLLKVCTIVERELIDISNQERENFLKLIGQENLLLQQLISKTFSLLNLACFFTVGPKEVRAWIYKQGSKATQVAGVIHSDFEKFFIRAKVIKYDDFVNYQSEKSVQEAGKLRIEGKNYEVKDGDIIEFLIKKGS